MGEQSLGNRITLDVGESLFSEGDLSRDLYLIQFGCIRLYKLEGDVEVILDKVGAGGVIGEVAAIDGGTRSASAVAEEYTELLVISTQKFENILAKMPEWFKKISKILVQRLREVDNRIHSTIGGNCVANIAELINIMTYSPICDATDTLFTIPLKNVEDDAVDLLGLRVNDVTLAIETLKNSGFLELKKNKIIVTNRTGLDKFCSAVFQNIASTPTT